MKKLIYIMVVMLLSLAANAKKVDQKQFIQQWSTYEVSTVQVGQNGTKFLKVWGFGKNVNKAVEQAKKNAVHACLFRGVPGAKTARATPAIFVNQGSGQAAVDNFEYFYNFFEIANEYIQFVNLTTDGVPSGQDRHDVKGGYKVAIYVQVMYDNLREKMKNDGLLKSGSAGFTY